MNLGQLFWASSLVFSVSFSQAAPSATSTKNEKKQSKSTNSQAAKANKQVPVKTGASEKGSTTASAPGIRRPMVNSSISEFAFQPAPGYQSLSARTVYASRLSNIRFKKNGIDGKDFQSSKGFLLVTRYDRGLNNGWGLSGEIGTTTGPMETSSRSEKSGRSKGFTDLTFTARNHREVKLGELTYGGLLTFSPNERELSTNRDDGNMQTGGHSLGGFVGLQQEKQNYVWGGQFKHQMLLDRSQTYKTAKNKRMNVTISNGNTFEVEGFLEVPRGVQLYGASTSLTHTLPTDYTYRQGADKLDISSDNFNLFKVAAYGNFTFSTMKNLEVIPQVSYQKVMDESGGSLSVSENSEESMITLGARLSL